MTMTPSSAPLPEILAEFPLSASQTRCWIIDQAMPGTTVLNVAVRWQLDGPVASADLEDAFRKVIARHEILRTSFAETDGGPVQRVHATAPFQLGTVDLRPVPAADQEARVDAIARETAAAPFDLSQPGLIRATLIRLSGDRAILCYVVHQSCFDGFSIRVLGRDLGAALTGEDQDDLALQYGDYALWQQEYFASGVIEDDLTYWRTRLADAAYFEVPSDMPRPARKDGRVAHVNADLPDGFGDRLSATAQSMGLSKFALGCAVFSAALHRVTGGRDVLFGTQIAGRLEEELEPLIGVFINNLVLRFAADPDATLSQHVASAKPVVEGALVHQSLPFNRLVEALNPPRDPSRTPLISINFNLQSVFMETRTYGDVAMKSVPSHAPGALYDLDMAVMERPTGWRITLEYAEELFTAETAQAIVDTFVASFATAFHAPETPLSAIPLSGKVRGTARVDDARHDAALAGAERALSAHPQVQEAVAVVDGAGVYGFVIPKDTGAFPLESLPAAIMADLPPGTVTGLSVLAALPRTSTGAPNRSVLRVPRTRSASAPDDTTARETLTQVRQDWSDLLQAPDMPGTAHFFDMGGHSLLVLRLLGRLRDRWGVSIDLAELYETPVLQDFARLVADRRGQTATPASDPGLLRLRREGTGQPFIAINNAATALALSTLPDQDRPVSCVRMPEMELPEDADFVDVARHYETQVRSLQPEGPYLLYGNCVHGNLALETARLLQADGAKVAVAMKDVWEPEFAAAIHEDRALRRLDRRHMLKVRLRDWRGGELSTAALLGSYGIFHRTGILRALHALRLIRHARRTDLEEGQERFVSAMSRARDRYRPAPVTFPVLHVVTNATPSGANWKPSIGWEDVVVSGALTTVSIPRVYVSKSTRIGMDAFSTTLNDFLRDAGIDRPIRRK
ncbi:condensation domain-containing protein [Jannaschia sp. 2305UL9-9]|uniref:condensation domain-containing protein n=1 Tax=Jannaschia sp. 2305UL9-9 TaxID=3121638 RepID=UPI0035287128